MVISMKKRMIKLIVAIILVLCCGCNQRSTIQSEGAITLETIPETHFSPGEIENQDNPRGRLRSPS